MWLNFHILFMILSGFSSDEPNRPGISPGVVAVLCGVLCEVSFPHISRLAINASFPGWSVFFFPFMVAFLWWRTVHPYLQAFTGWVSETGQKAKKWFSRSAYITGLVPHHASD